MFGSLRAPVVLIPLVLFALLALPIIPRAESASADLRTAEIEPAGNKLLGENEAPVAEPPDNPSKNLKKPETGATRAMKLTVPKLGIKNLTVPTAATQAELDREGIIHLKNTGVPWQEGSNTFIVGHALGFMYTKVPYVFYKLDTLRPGDEIFVKDTAGKEYVYRVYDLMTVRPADYWVTYPVAGKTVISLQTCTPIPTFENRLIVRGELING